jgi:hypothetical protein
MLMQDGLSQGLVTTKQIQTLQQRKRQQCSTELQLWTAENASTQPRRSCQHSVGRMQMEPAEAAADSATWTVRCVAEMQSLEQFGQAATTNLLPAYSTLTNTHMYACASPWKEQYANNVQVSTCDAAQWNVLPTAAYCNTTTTHKTALCHVCCSRRYSGCTPHNST